MFQNLTSSSANTATRINVQSVSPILTGTIAVTNGLATVTGTGTNFLLAMSVNDIIIIAGTEYTVLSVSSDTSLTLTANFTGTTTSGLSYTKIPALSRSTATNKRLFRIALNDTATAPIYFGRSRNATRDGSDITINNRTEYLAIDSAKAFYAVSLDDWYVVSAGTSVRFSITEL
jgi:hypothetical protein